MPRGIRVQFLHELVAPIRHNLSTSPGRSHSTRKERDRVAQGRLPIFMPLGACKGITIPTKQKRRSTGPGAKKPLDPQRPEKTWVPAGASGHELSRPKRVSWLPAYGRLWATSIPVSCAGVKTHVFMNDLVVKSQGVDIIEVILWPLRRFEVVQTSGSNRTSRCERLSPSETHWATTKSDGMC